MTQTDGAVVAGSGDHRNDAADLLSGSAGGSPSSNMVWFISGVPERCREHDGMNQASQTPSRRVNATRCLTHLEPIRRAAGMRRLLGW
jgi:hypothetical protein